ncbi:hypothetical protein QAD02_000177 [Eretmocerus hayati]|uniref:Uncharacterized protein n=1 Tax=Eretmocerus hayati TaxID=131215 RepID=A0ACC2NCT9_9HYME|nr:hypothetical protein QAD02_000177 [Eretmocerus hayati]
MTRIETFPKRILEAFSRSFANLSPVRVLLKIAEPEELPPGLPSNVMTQSWFDQIQVLKHRNVRVFITHGGLMGIQESVYYGKPMVAIPLFGDQPTHVANCVKRHIAIKVDVQDISEESMTDAVLKILGDSTYKEAVQKVSSEFKDHLESPLKTAIFWTEYMARHDIESLKHPASDLSWWQACLIDIYCFVIVIVVTTLCVFHVLTIKLCRILCSLTVVQRWLDESDQGCIYFSFGSMTRIETFSKDILDAFYRSFENISPARVLLKIAKPEDLPVGLPSNVLIQSWFDQIQVLKHRNVKGFITHGGLMSIQESVYYEVPMVGIPLFGDQPSNVANCVKRQIAIKVDVQDISEESMTDAILKILRDSTYKEAVQNVSSEFKDHLESPLNTAIFWTEYIGRHGKDSLKLPASDLSWWQTFLIEIYMFLKW